STYTVVIVGAYPNYQAVTFEEPKNDTNAQLSLYEASPAQPDLDFGRFEASNGSGFTKLGSAHFGNVATVSLGKSVTNLGGYVGHGATPITCGGSPCGKVTVAQLNSFDRKGALPFNKASRLSLFVFDPKNTASTFGSLDP